MAATQAIKKGRYAGKSIPTTLSTSIIPAEKWTDTKISTKNTYKIGVHRDKKVLLNIVCNLINSLKSSSCNPDTGKEITIICHHLYDNLSKSLKHLVQNYDDGEVPLDYTEPTARDTSTISKVMKKVQKTRPKTEDEEKLSPEQLRVMGLIENPFENTVSYEEEVEEEIKVSDVKVIDASDISNDTLVFCIYMFAFVVKVIAKSEDNLVQSYKAAIDKFSIFYVGRVPYTAFPPINKTWAKELKAQFHNDITLTRTIVRLVAFLERDLSPETSQAGMIRFLFCLPLSYAGMHAYKLFVAVKLCSGLDTLYLLETLVHPATSAALDQIVEILENYEGTENSNKPTLYKYARLAGPQFYQPLQTKSCPALVYCLVKLLTKYEGSGSDVGRPNYNPMSIAGLSNLSSDIKAIMDRAADHIFMKPPPDNYEMYSDIMKEATFMGASEPPKKVVIDNPFA